MSLKDEDASDGETRVRGTKFLGITVPPDHTNCLIKLASWLFSLDKKMPCPSRSVPRFVDSAHSQPAGRWSITKPSRASWDWAVQGPPPRALAYQNTDTVDEMPPKAGQRNNPALASPAVALTRCWKTFPSQCASLHVVSPAVVLQHI